MNKLQKFMLQIKICLRIKSYKVYRVSKCWENHTKNTLYLYNVGINSHFSMRKFEIHKIITIFASKYQHKI